MELTARSVAALKPQPKAYSVTDELIAGLAVRVAPNGKHSWSLRYYFDGNLRRLTLSKVATLAEARERARAALKEVSAHVDPALKKSDRRAADTVATFAEIYIERHAKAKKRSWKSDRRMLERDVLPHWKHKLMTDISRRDVRELLDRIVKRGATIRANRTRSLLHKLFAVAITLDVIPINPVDGTDKPGVERQRDRVLTYDEIRQFWAGCDALPLAMGSAFKLRLLTAQRGGEVFGMRWSEIDLETSTWTIPAARSKNGLPHRVPLSAPVLKILTDLQAASSSMFVLAGARGSQRSRAKAAATLKLPDFIGHDLRRTAASLMTGSGTPRLVVSKILNHAENHVTSVYDRHSYDNEKKIALDQWARTLESIISQKDGANVVAFAARA
jgi:integrase